MLSQTNLQSPAEHTIEVIAQLDLRDDVRDDLTKMVLEFAPRHGLRSIATRDIQKTIEATHPEHLPAYLRIAEQIPQGGPFSYLWLGYHLTLMSHASSLIFPDLEFVPMVHSFMRLSLERFFQNPIYQLIERGTGGGLSNVVEVIFRDNSFTNFGEASLHRDGPRHYQLFETETYSDWAALFSPPFVEGLFDRFGVKGKLVVDKLSAHTIEVDIQWE